MRAGQRTSIWPALFLAIVVALALVVAGCGAGSCSHPVPPGSGGTGGTGGGTSAGGPGDGACGLPGSGGNNGGGGGGSSFFALLYFMDGDFVNVDAASVTSSGTLSVLSGFTSPQVPASNSRSMVIANQQFLYVALGSGGIAGLSINPNSGALAQIANSPFATPTTGTADLVATDPLGQFLFVGSVNSPVIWVFQINPTTGGLTSVPGSPFTAPSHLLQTGNSMTVDASGSFLYVGQASQSLGVVGFAINSSGALAEIAGNPFKLGVAQVHANPAAEFLLGVAATPNQAGSAITKEISVFSIGINGVPTLVSSPVATDFAPYDFAILPSGTSVYTFGIDTTTGTLGSIEGFNMDTSTGALKAIAGSPFASIPSAFGCQFEPTGSFAFCFQNSSGTIFSGGTSFSVLTVSSTGTLSHTSDLAVNNDFPFAVTN